MPPKFRTIVLAAATFVVLGGLLVLFFQVRAEPELEVPEEALSQARAQYERSQRGSEAFQADRGAATTRPRRPPGAELAPPGATIGATGDLTGNTGDEPPVRRPAIRRSVSNVRQAGEAPAAGDPALQTSDDAKEPVRTAYEQGDFATALEQAQKYLEQFPGDGYVQRVAGVSACAVGEEAIARKYYALMTATDQSIVSRRCNRYGITLMQ
jgi:hypothetical protein